MPDADISKNEFGQPIGPPLPGWGPRPLPPRTALKGRFCSVEPLDPERHGEALFEEFSQSPPSIWTYLPDYMGPFPTLAAWQNWLAKARASDDPLWHAITDGTSGRAIGLACYLRIDRHSGVIEVGGLNYSSRLQRTASASEAMYLMMRRAFDGLGYRRYEWKCDTLNAPSRAAAERLGFRYEGTFRQHMVYRGRNRDTAWFGVTDQEWPKVKTAFERWLDPRNFDSRGRQIARLEQLRDRSGP